MGLRGPKPTCPYAVSRDECEVFTIMDVANERLLKPGTIGAGFVKVLKGEHEEIVDWLPIRSKIDAWEGILTVYKPYEQEIRVEAKKTP